MVTKNSIDSNIPIEISKGGTNATSFSTNGLAKFDGTSLVSSSTATLNASNYLNNTSQPCFGASIYTAMTNGTGDGTQLIVLFNHVYFNQSSSYNGATGLFTAPVSGNYLFTANVTLSGLTSSHTYANLFIYSASGAPTPIHVVNPFVSAASNGYCTLSLSCVRSVPLGAKVNVYLTVSGGAKVINLPGASGLDESNFTGCLLC